jgi:GNAT superfamily N-acetyltransferase
MIDRDPSTRIRPCTEADIDTVLELQRQWAEESITYGYVPGTHESLVAHLGQYFLLAEYDEQVVGYAYGTVRRSEGSAVIPANEAYLEIEEIYVDGAFRKRGIGSDLLDRLMITARSNGVARFLLYSASKDLDGILTFYRAHGFRSWYVQLFQ